MLISITCVCELRNEGGYKPRRLDLDKNEFFCYVLVRGISCWVKKFFFDVLENKVFIVKNYYFNLY